MTNEAKERLQKNEEFQQYKEMLSSELALAKEELTTVSPENLKALQARVTTIHEILFMI